MTTKTNKERYMDGDITHEEFYTIVLNDAGIVLSEDSEMVQRAIKSTDKHFNDIPLWEWDMMGNVYRDRLTPALRKNGDMHANTSSSRVCAMKQAVRNVIANIK